MTFRELVRLLEINGFRLVQEKGDSVCQSCAKRVHGLKVHLADHATAIDRFFSGFSPVMSRYLFPETQLS